MTDNTAQGHSDLTGNIAPEHTALAGNTAQEGPGLVVEDNECLFLTHAVDSGLFNPIDCNFKMSLGH